MGSCWGSKFCAKQLVMQNLSNFLILPIIILRDKKNKIRVFHNVCSHRGYKILQKPCNIKNTIRCPYHSWAYNTDGKLIATPHIGGMNKHSTKNFNKSDSGLKEIRSAVWLRSNNDKYKQ